jgi:hypothetical protein
MKITILLEYPDGANPTFSSGDEALGGRVVGVAFSDLFEELEKLEDQSESSPSEKPQSHPAIEYHGSRVHQEMKRRAQQHHEMITLRRAIILSHPPAPTNPPR